MSLSEADESELQSSVRGLSIGGKDHVTDIRRPRQTTSRQRKHEETYIADSWEDEADSSEDDEKATYHSKRQEGDSGDDSLVSLSASRSISNTEGPLDPPPTPISPARSLTSPQPWLGATVSQQGSAGLVSSPILGYAKRPAGPESGAAPTRRAEKQTVVAGRMIASALGIRAPKRTPEQRAYDRVAREQEIKRRNREKELEAKAKEEEERARAAIWNE